MALNILVVDDSRVMRKMVIKTLRLSGLDIGDVYEAGDGREGLDQLEENWVDMVFVDINMPVMNGEEMIRHIRENAAWNDMPIVVVSTEGSRTRIERVQQEGAKFIHKPFSPEVVRAVIQELTGVGEAVPAGQGFDDDLPAGPEHADVSGVLHVVALQTLESLAFLLTVDDDDPPARGEELLTELTFDGFVEGTLQMVVPTAMLEELACNMLGVSETPTRDQQIDSLKELLNVICGNLLPAMMGAEAVFNVGAPGEPAAGDVSQELYGRSAAASASLSLDYGQLRLALFVNGQLPQVVRAGA